MLMLMLMLIQALVHRWTCAPVLPENFISGTPRGYELHLLLSGGYCMLIMHILAHMAMHSGTPGNLIIYAYMTCSTYCQNMHLKQTETERNQNRLSRMYRVYLRNHILKEATLKHVQTSQTRMK